MVVTVIGDLPPGTRRNTYLPPEPTKGGYTYNKPTVTFPKPTPTFPTRPSPTFPGPRPTPTYPGSTRTPGTPPSTGYPTRPSTIPGFPDYTGQPSGPNGNAIGPGVSTKYTYKY